MRLAAALGQAHIGASGQQPGAGGGQLGPLGQRQGQVIGGRGGRLGTSGQPGRIEWRDVDRRERVEAKQRLQVDQRQPVVALRVGQVGLGARLLGLVAQDVRRWEGPGVEGRGVFAQPLGVGRQSRLGDSDQRPQRTGAVDLQAGLRGQVEVQGG